MSDTFKQSQDTEPDPGLSQEQDRREPNHVIVGESAPEKANADETGEHPAIRITSTDDDQLPTIQVAGREAVRQPHGEREGEDTRPDKIDRNK